ncbi:uncharacterized protein BDZ99DRAFT_549458 [Mytilinidion resinicola]|uniref:Uncharacterized protein n=1 Tax=Mytilinidion resinicola TaxID=574789 RepID=A0A6A6Z2P2_9PEZI|nr:uncharacterized protein BDZ99DRAFT_549458 [Mytilinidion resinicola]KAF2815009.1 hypothetical protein BDZ99DRAFT_549458 [Mytilinidion resinicola]
MAKPDYDKPPSANTRKGQIPPSSSKPSDAKPKPWKKLTYRERAQKEREKEREREKRAKQKEAELIKKAKAKEAELLKKAKEEEAARAEKAKQARERARLARLDKEYREAQRLIEKEERKAAEAAAKAEREKAAQLAAEEEREKAAELAAELERETAARLAAEAEKEKENTKGKQIAPASSSAISRASSPASTENMTIPDPGWSFSRIPSNGPEVYDVDAGSVVNPSSSASQQRDLVTEPNTKRQATLNGDEGPSSRTAMSRASDSVYKVLKAEIKDLKKQNETLNRNLADQERAISKLLSERTKNDAQHDAKQAKTREEKATLERVLVAKEQELKGLVRGHLDQEEAWKQQSQVWKDDYDSVCKERDALKEEAKEEVKQAEAKRVILEVERDIARTDLNKMYKAHDIAQERAEKEKQARERISNHLERANSTIAKLNGQLEELESKMEELKSAKLPTPPCDSEPGDAQKQLQQERDAIREEREAVKKERDSMKIERDAAKTMLDALRDQQNADKRTHRNEVVDLKAQIKKLRERRGDADDSSSESDPEDSLVKPDFKQKYEDLFAKYKVLMEETVEGSSLKRKYDEMQTSSVETAKQLDATQTKCKNISDTYIKVNRKYGKLRAAVADVGQMFGGMTGDDFGNAGRAIKRLKRELLEIDDPPTQSE